MTSPPLKGGGAELEMSNPSVTFRVSPKDRERLTAIAARTGKSLGQIIRENLGLAERNEAAAFIRGLAQGQKLGFDRGLAEGKKLYAIYFYCSVCREYDMIVMPGTPAHRAVVDALYEKGWGHSGCHQRQGK